MNKKKTKNKKFPKMTSLCDMLTSIFITNNSIMSIVSSTKIQQSKDSWQLGFKQLFLKKANFLGMHGW